MLAESEVVHTDPEILAGEPVFVGTRVPLKNLFDYLGAGDSLETFLDAFPDVTREQAVAVLDLRPVIPRILEALTTVQPGEVATITRP